MAVLALNAFLTIFAILPLGIGSLDLKPVMVNAIVTDTTKLAL
jgi:hypothetical protein